MLPRKSNRLVILLLIILLVLAGIYLLRHRPSESKADVKEQSSEVTNNENNEKIPAPSDIVVLPDSSRILILHKVSFNSSETSNNGHTIKMDGDMFFDIRHQQGPFMVHTRLLNLSVTGPAAFRVIAYSKEEGEEVQVLYGNIVAKKSYKSDFPEPEILGKNNLLMINKSIDLMEKEENLDTRNLREWKKKID